MEYNVLRRFRDKYTRETHLPGDIFVSDEAGRIKDLLSRGLIKELQDYSVLTKKELIELLEKKNIKYNAKAKKEELIQLLQGGD